MTNRKRDGNGDGAFYAALHGELRSKIRWAIGTTLDANGVSSPPYRLQQKIAGGWASELVTWLKLREEKPDLEVTFLLDRPSREVVNRLRMSEQMLEERVPELED